MSNPVLTFEVKTSTTLYSDREKERSQSNKSFLENSEGKKISVYLLHELIQSRKIQ